MIKVTTGNPGALLAEIKKAIDDKKIKTWRYDGDGDFTHSVDQFDAQAWLRPLTDQNGLFFGIVKTKDVPLTRALYGIYQGRFIEMLVTHFPNSFDLASATPLLKNPPDVAKKLD